MKHLKNLLVLAIVALTLPAFAQRSFDLFSVPRTAILSAPFNHIATTQTITNGPVDIRVYDGIVSVDLSVMTNSGTAGGTMTAQLYSSTDTTNLIPLTSIAAITSTTSVQYTNNYFGGGTTNYVTNKWELPGTIVTPTASSAGFATKYLNPASVPFTNAGALTVTGPGFAKFGFNAGDAPRYLYVVWQPGGTVTNFTTGAIVTGMTHDTMIGW